MQITDYKIVGVLIGHLEGLLTQRELYTVSVSTDDVSLKLDKDNLAEIVSTKKRLKELGVHC